MDELQWQWHRCRSRRRRSPSIFNIVGPQRPTAFVKEGRQILFAIEWRAGIIELAVR